MYGRTTGKRKFSAGKMSSAKKTKQASVKVTTTKVIPTPQSIRRQVIRELQNRAEQKIRVQSVTNFAVTSANGGVPTSIYLSPLLLQGTADNQRIGNRVNVTSSVMNMFMNLLPYNSLTNTGPMPVMVKIWIARYKIRNTSNVANTTVATDFFQNDGTTNGFAGNMLDMCYAVNEQSWDLLETRTFKLGVGDTNATQAANTASWLDDSSFSKEIKFDFTPYIKGMHEWNDNTNVPTNRNLWMFIQTVYADGSNTGGLTPIELHNSQITKFTDS